MDLKLYLSHVVEEYSKQAFHQSSWSSFFLSIFFYFFLFSVCTETYENISINREWAEEIILEFSN